MRRYAAWLRYRYDHTWMLHFYFCLPLTSPTRSQTVYQRLIPGYLIFIWCLSSSPWYHFWDFAQFLLEFSSQRHYEFCMHSLAFLHWKSPQLIPSDASHANAYIYYRVKTYLCMKSIYRYEWSWGRETHRFWFYVGIRISLLVDSTFTFWYY